MKLRNRATAPTIVERSTPLVGAARDLTTSAIDSARPHVSQAANAARGSVLDAANVARDAVVETLVPAVTTTASRVADAARDDIAPKVAAAVLAALAASEPVREEAQARGGAVLAALKGEVVVAPKRSTHRVRRSLGLLALLGAAGAAWTALQRRRAGDPWSVPSTPSTPASPASPSSSASPPHGDAVLTGAGAASDPVIPGVSDVTVVPEDSAETTVLSTSDIASDTGDSGTDSTSEGFGLLPGGPDEDVKDLR